MLGRVTTAELEAFVAVAELGSFTDAARRLHLTQPSTTARVQRLESALRTRLLVRTTRTVGPTAAGVQLLESVRPLLDGLDGALRAVRPGSAGRVVVATTPYLATTIVYPLVRRYGRTVPDVEVEVLDVDHPEVLRTLERGDAQLAVLSGAVDGSAGSESLGSDDVVLALPPGHRLQGRGEVDAAELAGCELMLIRPYEVVYSRLACAVRAATGAAPVARWVGSLTTLLGLLAAGGGIAVMTRGAARRDGLPDGSMLRVRGLELRRDYAMVRAPAAVADPAVADFARFVARNVRFPGDA